MWWFLLWAVVATALLPMAYFAGRVTEDDDTERQLRDWVDELKTTT